MEYNCEEEGVIPRSGVKEGDLRPAEGGILT
jgi:hypothetical protein